MVKSLKEYMSGHRIGYVDNISTMTSLGDTPPKGQGSKDSRAVGLNANSTSHGLGTIKPFLTANAKKIQTKKTDNYKSKNKEDIKKVKESALYNHMVDKKIIKD
jgi:hypothetical protein